MKRVQIDSSSLASVGFDSERGVLEVEFHNGSLYEYEGVGKRAYSALLAADSKGRHFNAEIRDRYTTRRLR